MFSVGEIHKWLVVGLGNPGPEYARTRHNLGFMVVDRLAGRMQTRVARSECRALVGRGLIGDAVVELAKPQTYMNASGESVSCLIAKPDRSIEKLIVVSDDLALPFETLRIRPKGSHGGQNGLRSIIDCLGTQDFTRLRIGIAPEHELREAKGFVLDNFSKSEAAKLDEIIEKAVDAVEKIVTDGIDAAMQQFN